MTAWLRRAGRGRTTDGADVLWSLAEGERGRRWRWTMRDGGRLVHVGLVERDPSGAFARLELAAPAGLLTFHPAPDGRLAHGNVVGSEAVRPIAVAWQAGWAVALEGDPFGSTVAGWQGAGLWIGRDLAWQPPGRHAGPAPLETDERGVPELLDAREWPLEE
jgi:hypothetical protein